MFSLIAIVLLGIFFEWLRSYAKGVDRKILAKEAKGRVRLGSSRDGSRERGEEASRCVFLARISSCSCSQETGRSSTVSRASRLYRSLLYAVIVFISFFLMLVFMTYNVRDSTHGNCKVLLLTAGLFPQAYLILATVVGAGIGHYLFSEFSAEGNDKGMACH